MQSGKKKGWLICLTLVLIMMTCVSCIIIDIGDLEISESSENESAESIIEQVDPTEGGTIYCYYYTLLTDTEKSYYRRFYQSILNFEDCCVLDSTNDLDMMYTVRHAVQYDHPELFWIPQSYMYQQGRTAKIFLNYRYTQEEAKEMADSFASEAAACVELLQNKDDYGKVLGVYEYLIKTNTYDGSQTDGSIASGFEDRKTICSGYANQMKYLLDALGVPCIFISANPIDGNGDGHAWNLVQMDGEWYHVDATWGDPVGGDETYISYIYMGLTDEEIYKDHPYCIAEYFVLPEARGTKDNYFRHEGLYFETYSSEALIPSLQAALKNGEAWMVRFSDQAYADAMVDLMDNGGIWDLVEAAGCKANHISYSEDEEFGIFRVEFSYSE